MDNEIQDMNIEDRIIINAPAERIFAHMFNIEHQRIAEYCKPSVIADSSQTIFYRRTLLNLLRRMRLGSDAVCFEIADIEPYRKVTFSPAHWSGRIYSPRISYEFDELAGRTEVISKFLLPLGILDKYLNRQGLNWIKYAMSEYSECLKKQIEKI